MKYYIKDNFYFDIDHQNQFRITGPQNHLFAGITFPRELTVDVKEYELKNGQLEVTLALLAKKVSFSAPLVTDIRTLRTYTEATRPQPTFAELLERKIHDIVPQKSKITTGKQYKTMTFLNSYTDEFGKTKRYGVKVFFPKNYKIFQSTYSIGISSSENIEIKLRTVTNIRLTGQLRSGIFLEDNLPSELFNKILLDIYQESGQNIEHLVKSKKTSSFEYGTIFPRDWIESADLGVGDLTPDTVDYMYAQSMNYVSDTGEGWHEEAIGEYRAKLADPRAIVDRKMIDIEPRYIVGFPFLSKRFITRPKVREKLRRIGNYVLENARERSLMTFKKISEGGEEYYLVGNWRDSYNAFPRQKSPLAPYDVNCVFYPTCLRMMRQYKDYFTVENPDELNEIISKWEQNKLKFRLYHADDLIGYALALHGKKNIPISIAHLDESYDMFYGVGPGGPSMEEVVSFARKLIDPDYFYTPGGPMLVAADEESMSTKEYHGKVIWPKQAAFAIAGLTRQYKLGLENSWPQPVLETIKNSIIFTSHACFRGWEELGAVPELYYFDVEANKAKFYTDQSDYEGQMSLIQLWSSVGARRIMRDYAFVVKHS